MNATHSIVEHRGCKLSWSIRGAGPPVLWIQGTGLHGDGWLPQVEDLARHYSCLLFDNRGIGRSLPAGTPITVEQMAEDAAVVMAAAGWSSAHVVGHSLGGLVALALGLAQPQRVRSLALLCTFARGADPTRFSWDMFKLGLRTYVGTRRMRRHAFLEMVMPPEKLAGVDRDELAARWAPLFGHDLAEQPPVVFRQLAAMKAYDASPHLERLAAIPSLVVVAGQDRIVRPEFGRALAAGLPGARLREFPDSGHGIPLERPAEINELLNRHFAGVRWSGRSEGNSI